jgi:hypothetical protein
VTSLPSVTVHWDDNVDDIIAGDAAAGFASITPAKGVVIFPMAPMGIRDREAGTITVTSSLGLPKKIARIKANPSVAIAYHAREHGYSNRPEYVLVQGTASVPDRPDKAWLESITPEWERFLGPRHRFPGSGMDIYYWQRLAITVTVRRVLVYDGHSVSVVGEDLPDDAPAQRPPKNGTGPRESVSKAAGHVDRLPHSLLGWVGGDGLPMVARVSSCSSDDAGLRLRTGDGPLPQGGRRAGLTSHSFKEHMVGQEQRVYTGWLEVDGDKAVYAPHTKAGHVLPRSTGLMVLATAVAMPHGYRQAGKLGLVSD